MGESPIALRSKKKLIDALERLILEENFQDITITKLCNEAKLSRPAFYQNFDSITDVAARCIAERARESYSRIALKRTKNAEDLAGFFIDIMNSDYDFVALMVKQNLAAIVTEQYSKLFATLDQTLGFISKINDEYLKSYYAEFISAGSAAAIVRWFDEDTRLTRSEITDIIATMISSLSPAKKASEEKIDSMVKIG